MLKVYKVIGQEVATLVNEMEEDGFKSVAVHAGNYASGVYFYRILAGDFSSIKKILLVR